MSFINRLSCSLAVSALTLITAPALAQDGGPRGGPPQGGWTVGVFGFSSETAYGFNDNAAVPMVEYENEYFKLGVPSVEVKLPWLSDDNISFGVTVDLFGAEGGYKASDAPILRGMAERKSGLWAGAVMEWKNEVVDLSFKALRDVGGDSKGSSFEIAASRNFFVGERFMISPSLTATRLDAKTVDYYYGVRASEATAGRAAYTGSATVNLKAGVNFGYMLTDNQMLMLDISATKLGSGIADSPIAVDDTLTSIGLGYMFRF